MACKAAARNRGKEMSDLNKMPPRRGKTWSGLYDGSNFIDHDDQKNPKIIAAIIAAVVSLVGVIAFILLICGVLTLGQSVLGTVAIFAVVIFILGLSK
jgi:hypothetical protein